MHRIDKLNNLFAAVQLLAPEQTDSTRLFRETIEGIRREGGVRPDDDQIRIAFYGKLVSIIRESLSAEEVSRSSQHQAIKQEVAEEAATREFASSFLQLKPGEQLLLFLSAVEEYGADSIAEITGFEADHVERQIESVRKKLNQIITERIGVTGSFFQEPGVVPRDLIDREVVSFVDEYLEQPGSQIQKYVESQFSPGISAPVSESHSRPAASPRHKHRKTSPLAGIAAGGIIIVFAGLAALAISTFVDDPMEEKPVDMLTLSVDKANQSRPVLGTSENGQAERFILTHFNRIVSVPVLDGATLTGVGSTEIQAGRRIPSLLYKLDQTGERIVVFGYTYAVLNDLYPAVTVRQGILKSLEEEGSPVVAGSEKRPVVVWRNADDLFVAVLPADYADPKRLF